MKQGRHLVKLLVLAVTVASAHLSPAQAAEPAKAPASGTVFDHTITGQPLILPQGPVAVAMRVSEFPAGFHGPVHKQPYPRYAYVLSGRLRVTYDDQKVVREFGPGELMVEGVDQWHSVEAVGPEAVKVMVIDQTPPGAQNVVIRGR
jgi:quercetin dioxygenase-like cupin family protein